MANLIVPMPSLKLEPPGPGLATLEMPVTIVGKPVFLPDGTPLTDQVIGLVPGFFLYRQPPGSAYSQIWDSDQKLWKNANDTLAATLKPKPLAYKKDQAAAPWEGVFVAAADKDAVQAGPMSYYFRTRYAAPFGGGIIYGFSPPTPSLHFVAAVDTAQAGIKLDAPDSATDVRLFLRNTAKQIIGSVYMSNVSGQARIEISNSAGASVRLTEGGDIELQPAAGRSVVVLGPLVAQHISYQPDGTTIQQWLKAT